MEDFTTLDRLRALTCGFLPTCRLAPSSSFEDLLNSDSIIYNNLSTTTTTQPPQHSWYEQSRPTTATNLNNQIIIPSNRDNRNARRDADMLSLHENIGETVRRVRPRRGNGDISGGGGGNGSGLSRWTLFTSWWSGKGALRLEDSDEEGEEDATQVDHDLSFDENTIVLGAGEEDARPQSFNSSFLPPPATTSSSPSQSEFATESIETEEREARRARKRTRRAAREAGISIEEYEERMRVESLRGTRQSSKLNSQTSSIRSRESNPQSLINLSSRTHTNGNYTQVEETDDGVDEMFGGRKGSRRNRRKAGSRDSYSADGSQSTSDHRGSSNGSQSGRSPSRKKLTKTDQLQFQTQQFLSPEDYPSPSSSSSAYATSSSDGQVLNGQYTHHQSTSSTSTTSSGRKRRKQHSPLEIQQEFPQQYTSSYYQDEFGQLQYIPPGYEVHHIPSAGQYCTPEVSSYAQQQQQQQVLYQHPNNVNTSYVPTNSTTYYGASTDVDYSHIHPTPLSPLPPSFAVVPSKDQSSESNNSSESLDINKDITSHLASTQSILPQDVDPLEFLRALKNTRLPPPVPIVIPAILVESASLPSSSQVVSEVEEEVGESIFGGWGKRSVEFVEELGESSTRWAEDLSEDEEDDDEEEEEEG